MRLNNILSIGAVAAGLALSSCGESFLDVESKLDSNVDNFYTTQTNAVRALIGCYDGWRQISSNPGNFGFYVASTVMSDETFGATGNGDDFKYQTVDSFDFSRFPVQNLYETEWEVYYAGIYRCNMLIQNEEKIAWESEADRGRLMGECRAIRALLYFDLVRLFGNIPLLYEPSVELLEQADPAEVYALIFEDLRYAINNIPSDMYHTGTTNPEAAMGIIGTWGRITKQTAEGILARAYLYYSGYYGKEPGWTNEEGVTTGDVTKQEALAALEDVISSGYYSLVPDFKNLWVAASVVPIPGEAGWDTELSTYIGDENAEILLSQNFTPTQDYDGNNDSNRWLVMMGLREYNTNGFNKPYGQGWGGCTVCPAFYNYFSSNDQRRVPTVIDLEAEGLATGPDWESSVSKWREYTGYTVKKYTPMVYGNGNPATNETGIGAGFMECNPTHWVILRYADILLMAAELGSPNAQSYMDQVRARAGLSSVTASKENIMEERKLEFAMEGIRYWDLLRLSNGGDVTDLVNAIMVSNNQSVLNGGLEGTVTYDPAQILAKRGLSQIPQYQINLSNEKLKQNTGW